MNTISSTQNSISAYAQNEKVLKALETAKIEQQKKETEDDSIKISQQALQTLGNTSQATTSTRTISPLDTLVSNGIITQTQSDAVQSAFKSTGKAIQSSGVYTSRPKNPLDSLVTSGTITQTQEDTILKALESSIQASTTKSHKSKGELTNPLDNLVSSGTITHDQETSIESAFEAAI